jgi:ParB family chromosome partitioning protein
MKRQALGKGLGSLLPPRPGGPAPEGFIQVDVDQIVPNPSQPREQFDEAELGDLAASIKTAGVLQPILVRDTGKGFELIAGERRWRAARMAGLRKLPAMVQKGGGQRSLELALIENIQRQQLNAIEEARAFSLLMEDYGLTQEQVAERVGRKRPSVANTLRLLKLPDRVQELVKAGKLTPSHAKALLALHDDEEILKAADAMLEGYVTSRAAEENARRKKSGGEGALRAVEEQVDPNVRDAEERLQRALGTKVHIRQQGNGRGRIEIEFYSQDELDRLFEMLERPGRGMIV